MAGVFGWAQPQQEGKILLAQVTYALSFDHKRTASTVIMVIIIRSVSTVHGRNSIAVPREKKVGWAQKPRRALSRWTERSQETGLCVKKCCDCACFLTVERGT